ncbi:MAG: glycosyltransferase family 39 protein [Candidatus Caenarcaniphilales bacterium]|nr:glycosyltransferase family 39 protein [Candidatus Caenarcaniphilales bacterium]
MFNFQIFSILILSFIILSFSTGAFPIAGVDEGRFAQSSANMLAEMNLIVPFFDGEMRLEKPILFYWEQIISFLAFGKTEFAARFPSILAGTGMVYLAYILGSIQGTPIFASLIILSSLGLNIFSKIAITDMSFCFLVSSSLAFFFLSYFHKTKASHIFNRQSLNTRIYFYISAIFLALAILCKGPLALVIYSLVIFIFLIQEKEVLHFFSNKKYDALAALILVLAIVLPWYILIHQETAGAFTESFFMNDNINRFFKTMSSHKGPFWFYMPSTLLLLFPWSFFIPQALFGDTSSSKISRIHITDHTNSLKRFATIWFLAVLIFFSIAQTKLITYILPLMLPLSLLIAKYCSDLINSDGKNSGNKSPGLYFSFLCIFLSLPILAFIGMSFFGEALSKLGNNDISFFIILISIIFSCSIVIAITALKENSKFSFSILTISSVIAINMFVNFIGVPIFKSMDKGVKDFCEKYYDKTSKIYTFKLQRGSIGFYCENKVKQITKKEDVLFLFEDDSDFYLIIRKKDSEAIKEITGQENLENIFEIVKENRDYLFFRAHT